MSKQDVSQTAVSGSSPNRTRTLIYSAAFAAIYIVAMVAIVMATSAISPVVYLGAPLIVGAVLGVVYMLAVLRSKSIMPVVIMGAGFLLTTGMSNPYTFACEAIVTVVACVILAVGKFKSKAVLGCSYAVFNLNMAMPFLLLLIAHDSFIAMMSQAYGAAAADAMSAVTPDWIWWLILALAIVGGILGALIGIRLTKKHFDKAGIA
ncbi:MptD family putative ECF transporter S component [Curtanaerobium respiraculi]|jgi:energy-coupling factor transport system substrate-specific component|uniref:MptD family putative ECF transporter S component n=1 Tax=Curtanaerobium respiraculi TaxID=2949669 RepID=UPI0024B38A94|nr:MptD family putative ECF transporter S component [Curtanaerobium respiraculi]